MGYRWILSSDPHSAKARKVIRKLRGLRHESDVDEEVNNFLSASSVAKTTRGSAHSSGAMWDLITNINYRPLLIASIGLQMSQQLCGINAVFYYSTAFFTDLISNPLMGTCYVNTVNVIATFVAMKLMDNTNRRTLLLWSSAGMFLACLLLTASALGYTHKSIALFAVMAYVTFFEIGLGPIPWLITAEYFDAKYVATAMSLACIVNWACNFLVGFFFPYMQAYMGAYTFVPFAAVLAITFLFTQFYVTESYGRTVEEIYKFINMRNPRRRQQTFDGESQEIRYEMIDGVFA